MVAQGDTDAALPCKIDAPDGHPKLLHLWPPKLLQAGRSDYGGLMLIHGVGFGVNFSLFFV
jgi:hypothetical protein